jgi:predicted dehydrogenase
VKQVTQRPSDGRIVVRDVPAPTPRPGWVLVATRCSLISTGTERQKVVLGRQTLVGKARARPDLVRKTVERARVEGIRSTVATVRDRLDAPAPMGYSCAGVVRSVGPSVEGLAPGDRVACAGAGWANHAGMVSVPKRLVAPLPDGVAFDDAAYTTVGAIAMHAVRQSGATIGERIGVIGLGLVGQLAIRLLKAAGCEPIGVDVDDRAVEMASSAATLAVPRAQPGLEHAIASMTDRIGLDAVLICAATDSDDPIRLACRLARDRGRIVIVGEIPVNPERSLLYEKELEVRVSRSYGPGRYDFGYEQLGHDMPPAYVRWTEERNLRSFLALVAAGKVVPSELTTHRFPVDEAPEAYGLLDGGSDGIRPFGVLLEFPTGTDVAMEPRPVRARASGGARVGVIGTGSFARGTLIPALLEERFELVAMASENGLSAAHAVARFGTGAAATADEILADDRIDAVVIATRHASHAELAAAALDAGKAVFVEKPLALTEPELADIETALERTEGFLMVGFNRRYAPLVQRLARELNGHQGVVFAIRVNAGPLDAGHWLNNPYEGGGRILGEACHFVDLAAHLGGAPITLASAAAPPADDEPIECNQNVVACLRCSNGATTSLTYASGGDARLGKERIEAFGGGTSIVVDDYRRIEVYRNGRRSVTNARRDKGHRAELHAFAAALRGAEPPPDPESYLATTRATLALAESLRTGLAVSVA